MVWRLVEQLAFDGFVSFATIRSLARRLKQPLSVSLSPNGSREATLLGLRLESSNGTTATATTTSTTDRADSPTIDSSKLNDKHTSWYADWTPPTDCTVATALAGPPDGQNVGRRCSYVGFEETEHYTGKTDPISMNVEKLAMEFYNAGHLPIDDDSGLSGGGWVGWHNEGGHLRALFRILCGKPLLGMDGGCNTTRSNGTSRNPASHDTIHLTPYQTAPFDLHVGSWGRRERMATNDDMAFSTECGSVNGFYTERLDTIEQYLSVLEGSTPQQISDAVYNSIKDRFDTYHHNRHRPDKNQLYGRPTQDPILVRDILQVRTLSMLAAGFGGKSLAAAFRCLLFDYRHYSGGLPDLLLVRAFHTRRREEIERNGGSDVNRVQNQQQPNHCQEAHTNGDRTNALVDLGQWVGESFTDEAKNEREAAMRLSFLIDQDDEFLGCTKMGDSAGGSGRSWSQRQRPPSRSGAPETAIALEMPDRLVLRYKEEPVNVECLFVEVKSANDRLDGRQEDWLNILDKCGNARVCKFEKEKKKTKKKEDRKDKKS